MWVPKHEIESAKEYDILAYLQNINPGELIKVKAYAFPEAIKEVNRAMKVSAPSFFV